MGFLKEAYKDLFPRRGRSKDSQFLHPTGQRNSDTIRDNVSPIACRGNLRGTTRIREFAPNCTSPAFPSITQEIEKRRDFTDESLNKISKIKKQT